MKCLVAGVGNIFLTDDGFGPEVARRLVGEPLPEGVLVQDFGIRGVHLAYELMGGYDLAILIDTAQRGGPPGTLYVIEPSFQEADGAATAASPDEAGLPAAPLIDAHGMEPGAVLSLLRTLGGADLRLLVVACEPVSLEEGMGLTDPVESAIPGAMGLVRDVIDRELAGDRAGAGTRTGSRGT
ncbi:MAG TPA: hydrogenase maturation protease [Myxococcaceae bacterium]